jgi:hypothetical protein
LKRLVIIEDCQKALSGLDLHGAEGNAFHQGSAIRSSSKILPLR